MNSAVQTDLAGRLSLSEEDMQLVQDILHSIIPGRSVWAFGSRAKQQKVKRFSDLDLAVEGSLTWAERAGLADAFDESLLPMKVDVVELGLVDEEFRGRIEGDFVVVVG